MHQARSGVRSDRVPAQSVGQRIFCAFSELHVFWLTNVIALCLLATESFDSRTNDKQTHGYTRVRSQGVRRSISRIRRQKGMVTMNRITIRPVAPLATGIFTLALALYLSAPCHAQVQSQQLQQIDKDTITIFDAFEAYPGYDVANAIDKGGPPSVSSNQYTSDYASHGGGNKTYISFDFGQQYTFTAILFTDRTTSGGPNDQYYGGTFDFNTSYMFTFSNDMTFATNVGQVLVKVNPPSVATTTIENFQTLSILSGIPPCQYIQWQVVTTNGNNPGAADFAFYGQ
jgi:hypothetical protein